MHLTIPQVAERLATTDDHVLDLIHAKKLRAVNIGLGKRRPRWRITAEALSEFEAARTSNPPPAPSPRKRQKLPADVPEVYPVG